MKAHTWQAGWGISVENVGRGLAAVHAALALLLREGELRAHTRLAYSTGASYYNLCKAGLEAAGSFGDEISKSRARAELAGSGRFILI
jgi:hypothetical protein